MDATWSATVTRCQASSVCACCKSEAMSHTPPHIRTRKNTHTSTHFLRSLGCFPLSPAKVPEPRLKAACLCVCRCQGYVYTYRLHKDHGGSWAADVSYFLVSSAFTGVRSSLPLQPVETSLPSLVAAPLFWFRCSRIWLFETNKTSPPLFWGALVMFISLNEDLTFD